ncbi:MAG: hypothetical protein Terrestrivirus6_54 [Terrestrivirus sp.]|uniref:DUF5869 domain-containing protein n=1 Tax=Terrestrivirus sp. TaxID=2487775 RepID=A0A3G4ZNJ0_9VIRU|nr:MAG: hypothetical protein Terrestrivirus6_54 [Terrestrivirus sp.]
MNNAYSLHPLIVYSVDSTTHEFTEEFWIHYLTENSDEDNNNVFPFLCGIVKTYSLLHNNLNLLPAVISTGICADYYRKISASNEELLLVIQQIDLEIDKFIEIGNKMKLFEHICKTKNIDLYNHLHNKYGSTKLNKEFIVASATTSTYDMLKLALSNENNIKELKNSITSHILHLMCRIVIENNDVIIAKSLLELDIGNDYSLSVYQLALTMNNIELIKLTYDSNIEINFYMINWKNITIEVIDWLILTYNKFQGMTHLQFFDNAVQNNDWKKLQIYKRLLELYPGDENYVKHIEEKTGKSYTDVMAYTDVVHKKKQVENKTEHINNEDIQNDSNTFQSITDDVSLLNKMINKTINKDYFNYKELTEAIHCTSKYDYSQIRKTAYKYETMTLKYKNNVKNFERDITFLINEQDRFNDYPMIQLMDMPICFTFSNNKNYIYGNDKYNDDDEDYDDDSELSYIFKHPESPTTWFMIKKYGMSSGCSSCDGNTSSNLTIYEEDSLHNLIRWRLTGKEIEQLGITDEFNYLEI